MEGVEALAGGVVGVTAEEVGGADEEDLIADIVHRDDLVEEHEESVGDVELVGGEGGELFDEADDVVGEEADGAGGEGGKAGEASGGMAGEGLLERFEDVGLLRVRVAGLPNGEGLAACGDGLVGLEADKGPAGDVLAAFDRLEEEGLRLLARDAEEGGDGGFEVGGHRAEDGNEGVGAGEFGEGGAGGRGGRVRHGGYRYGNGSVSEGAADGSAAAPDGCRG